jgi:uncharacterized protein YggT (Ycf19 family)
LELISEILYVLGTYVFAAAGVVAALLALRVIMNWLGSNPFGWFAYNLTRVTEPMVRPLRFPFSGRYTRFDMMPLLAAAIVLLNGVFVMTVLRQLAYILDPLSAPPTFTGLLVRAVRLLGLGYVVAIFLRFLLPYAGFGYRGKFMRFLFAVTEPLLKPLRRPLLRLFGTTPFDFTALVAVFIVWVVTGLIADILQGLT